jgi:D-glycero-D-manno-heptose 1,7-bisphosphate phosphatase
MSERAYLDDPDGVKLVPGVPEALEALREKGYVLVVTTNQSGIARGYYTENQYEAVARRLEEVLTGEGTPVDATYYCPHHPDFTGPCACRKPGTGMHMQAARDMDLDPERSWFVGDKVKDVLPAQTLGGRGILVRTGFGAEQEDRLPERFRVADDLLDAARTILEVDGGGPTNGGSDPA